MPVQPAVRRWTDRRGGLLGPCAAKVLRCSCRHRSPIAKEALDRIGQLYRVEETINGAAPDHRRRERQQRSVPIAEALASWAEETVRKLSHKSSSPPPSATCADAGLHSVRCFDDGRLALDNNPAERRCAASRSAARTICSPAPMPAAGAPPQCTR